MANEHPFQVLFETLGRTPSAHADLVNCQAYQRLKDVLTVPVDRSGRCILLRAPRAGHGKTHLLSRIQHELGASHEFIPLQASFGCRIDAASVTDDALRRLVRQLPASGGLTILDLLTRRLFASALQPLVASGEVPCQDREGALMALRARPIETFDFHHPNAITAHWARENFEVLGQRLSLELAQRCNLPVGGISFWVDALFHFAASPLENANRVRVLVENVHDGANMEIERLEALLGMVTLLTRVVLVADDLEGFSTDETAALRLAAFLGTLRQNVERLDVILSLNQDIWQSAFLPRLSGGLADRLSEVVVELEPLTEMEMEALLESRVPGLGRRVLDRIDVEAEGHHARGIIRAAGMAWLKATAMDAAPPPVKSVAPPAAMLAAVEVAKPDPVVFNEPVVAESPVEPAVESIPDPDPSPVEIAPEWPEPVFTPASEVEIVADPVPYEEALESPSVFDSTPSVSEESQVSPFTEQWQAPEPPPAPPYPSPEYSWNPPVQETTHEPLETPVDAYGPVDTTFQSTPEPPKTPDFQENWSYTDSSNFVVPPPYSSPQADSPFVTTYSEPFTPDPPVTSFAPPMESETFQAAPPIYNTPSEITPAPMQGMEPDYNPPVAPIEEAPPPSAADTDRVDDLLRQFRERYGRGSL